MRGAAGSGGVETNRLEVRLKLHVCLLGAVVRSNHVLAPWLVRIAVPATRKAELRSRTAFMID